MLHQLLRFKKSHKFEMRFQHNHLVYDGVVETVDTRFNKGASFIFSVYQLKAGAILLRSLVIPLKVVFFVRIV